MITYTQVQGLRKQADGAYDPTAAQPPIYKANKPVSIGLPSIPIDLFAPTKRVPGQDVDPALQTKLNDQYAKATTAEEREKIQEEVIRLMLLPATPKKTNDPTRGAYTNIAYNPTGDYQYSFTPHGSNQATIINSSDSPYERNVKSFDMSKPFTYKDFYNAAAGDDSAYDQYMTYLKSLPKEDLQQLGYGNLDTVGNGPLFVPRPDDKREVYTVASPANEYHGNMPGTEAAMWNLFNGKAIPVLQNKGMPHAYARGARWDDQTPSYIAVADFRKKYGPWAPSDNEKTRASMLNDRISASLGWPTLDTYAHPNIATAHELGHNWQLNPGAMGSYIATQPGYSAVDNGDARYVYETDKAEQMNAARTLNLAYQALRNDMRKNPTAYPAEHIKMFSAYPAYGTKQQFQERNQMLAQHPEQALKYLGMEANRFQAGQGSLRDRLQQLKTRKATIGNPVDNLKNKIDSLADQVRAGSQDKDNYGASVDNAVLDKELEDMEQQRIQDAVDRTRKANDFYDASYFAANR